MSVYFVYRSHYDNPGGFHVKVFPQDTVLEWFRSVWRGIPMPPDFFPDAAQRHAAALIGRDVHNLELLFTSIHRHDWPPPKTMTVAARRLEEALRATELRFGKHHLQLLTDDDDLEMVVSIFDGHYVEANPHRAAFLIRADWRLPDGRADDGFRVTGVRRETRLVRGDGMTYFAHFATYDSASLGDRGPNELRGVVSGVRVSDFPRHLFAVRDRLAADPDDEATRADIRQLLPGLEKVFESAGREEAAFLAALTADPNDYAGWSAYSDWRMENGKPPLLTEVLLTYHAEGCWALDTQEPARDEVLVQSHVSQVSKHIARRRDTDIYHHFILFDDLWASAHRDLAASILRAASRWDPL